MEEIEMESKRNLIERMFKTLSDREKIILSMSMGYNYDREYKDNEIADEIGLTSERVRQIKLTAIKKLQKFTVARY
jgi:RNA polymerase sigma factor (sigma-70 family)